MHSSPVHTLEQLHHARRRYEPADTAAKIVLLRSIAQVGAPVRSWRALDRLHDDLLFILAFPDSVEVLALATQVLGRIEGLVRRLTPAERAKADDSGIAGSSSRYAFEYPAARWLARRFASEIRIEWAAVKEPDSLMEIIAAGVVRAEDDALFEDRPGAREWLQLAGRAAGTTDFAALFALAPRHADAEQLFSRIYDAAQVTLEWRLVRSAGSTTRNVLPVAAPAYRSAMRRPSAVPRREIARPLPGIRIAKPPEAARVIDAARAALAARCREVFATSYANPEEVWLAPLGEGAELAVMGLPPRQRVSLEANYGYMLFVNGVPAAYGGVTPLYLQANTGINVFPPFRGSESAFLWTAMLRAFRTLFGVTRFVVNAVQFGEENDEAIESGAYWFYWRLGFRPASARLRKLAAFEAHRLAGGQGRRTSARTLRRLAVGDLHLSLSGARRSELFDERWLAGCALAATRVLAAEGTASRSAAARAIAGRIAAALGVRTDRWAGAEREAFERLAPVVALLPAVPRWGARDRRSLAALMRAKGAPRERDFVRLAAEHPRFFPELMDAVRAASRAHAPPPR